MRTLIWDPVVCDETAAQSLAAALDVSPVVARLLCHRGHGDPESAHRFLYPQLSQLHDPYGLTDMRAAVDRLCAALARKERIAIHGDYDVDGVTSTVILRRALELLGGDVTHFIPERLRDGYGLQVPAVERLHADGVRVIVSVDCGIRSGEAARRARELGVDLIITDHHEPEAVLPSALAVINPKRPDCTYPDKNLAGVGVAFKVVQALCQRFDREKWLPAFLKLAAIGTVADVVPLVGENRIIAKLGLQRLSQGPHTVGLRTLLESAGLQNTAIDGFHVAFVIAPRVNAAGRMSTPDLATRLLLASDESQLDQVRRLAEQLGEENTRRQAYEADIVADAKKQVETDVRIGAHNVLVVAGEGWHRGVIGIVASKLVDAFYKPSIVLSVEDGIAHGSCRSIAAFDMLGALDGCADLFEKYGGHKQAAGLTMTADRIPEFRDRINAHGLACLEPTDLMPRLRIDSELRLAGIDSRVVAGLEQMAPFGLANAKPVFDATGVELLGTPRRIKDRHLKVQVRQDGRVFNAIAWRAAEKAAQWEQHRQSLRLAYSLDKQTFRGETTIELTVADLRCPDQTVSPGTA
ncbi:Single-stranded-DNA-specific exonuclease RecJ [Luteitalea pratensis]|uniref:Single-stranded-DNA-specific exonuclease RecJ n=1 Tax=Luteitalea pratensis TaxID=1855912 RepID=A0A143PR70_LUTPR|nr:single-stranded-DNA-specific exonuclease RecJ [Luteitalea pratensis]AMY10299.1 Single-stranded-DNA-specific exonuclease RecJ [Luteitalea pratensis]